MNNSNSDLIVTGVDSLIELLKKIPRIDVDDAAKKLNFPVETVQSWVDFLVEENLVGIDYKLTKPVIYLITSEKSRKTVNLSYEFEAYKKEFDAELKKRSRNSEKAAFEWKEHLLGKLDLMKQFFFSEAEKRGLSQPEKLWEEYKQKINSM